MPCDADEFVSDLDENVERLPQDAGHVAIFVDLDPMEEDLVEDRVCPESC